MSQAEAQRAGAESTDRDAKFRQYVVPEFDVLYRVALSLTGSPANAEDLVQDTIVRAYRAIDRFDGRYPRSWLLTILRNTNINNARKKRPGLLRDVEEGAPLEQADDSPGAADPERSALEAEVDPALRAAFDSLSDDFRQVVELVDLNGLSYQEAAEIIDVPVGTIMSRLHRARRRMRDRLEKDGWSR